MTTYNINRLIGIMATIEKYNIQVSESNRLVLFNIRIIVISVIIITKTIIYIHVGCYR